MLADAFRGVFSVLANSASDIIDSVLRHDRRVLLYGPPGSGKSTLAANLARALAGGGRICWCLSADPGSPAFGVPGALSLASWSDDGWRLSRFEGLATLDAGRFRLPLLIAAQRLLRNPAEGVFLIDGPGVVRGIGAGELLAGLVEAGAVDVVLVMMFEGQDPGLLDQYAALAARVCGVPAAASAKRAAKRARARSRTAQWDNYLAAGVEQDIELSEVSLIGTPPPVAAVTAWAGRQVALIGENMTRAMGEVQRLAGSSLTVTLPFPVQKFDTLLVRDAVRSAEGVIETATPFARGRLGYLPPDMFPALERRAGNRLVGRVGAVDVALINGVFGDPLLHLRQRHFGRSLLFDLGEGGRLSAHIAHQVTDVFISHAHLDHIGGFLWLLRSRIGEFPPCRLFGPPGLAKHIAGFVQGVEWDRVADMGPVFDVAELHGDALHWSRIRVGVTGIEKRGTSRITGDIICSEPGFRIRAITLDHRNLPVLAYAYEPAAQINIRKDRLMKCELEPGHWLTELKQQLVAGNESAIIELPDGDKSRVRELAEELVLVTPGKKLVYATDLADTSDNRQRLIALAQHAHTFFCEATFTDADAAQAQNTGHLTARACGEIAAAAGVARLVPFHFSHRYENDPQRIYDQIRPVCGSLVAPG
jgi:ribonuclease BN (tRNA processing enzyme)